MDPTAGQEQKKKSDGDERSPEYAPYPSLSPDDVTPPPPPPPSYSATADVGGGGATTMPAEANPYVTPAPVPKSMLTSPFLTFLFLMEPIILFHHAS